MTEGVLLNIGQIPVVGPISVIWGKRYHVSCIFRKGKESAGEIDIKREIHILSAFQHMIILPPNNAVSIIAGYGGYFILPPSSSPFPSLMCPAYLISLPFKSVGYRWVRISLQACEHIFPNFHELNHGWHVAFDEVCKPISFTRSPA